MQQDRIDCILVAVENVFLEEQFRGTLRKEDVRFFEVDKIDIIECFRIGDLIRAQVLALGDHRSFVLSTATSDHFGVIAAQSAAGGQMVPISWQWMKCPLTGAK